MIPTEAVLNVVKEMEDEAASADKGEFPDVSAALYRYARILKNVVRTAEEKPKLPDDTVVISKDAVGLLSDVLDMER